MNTDDDSFNVYHNAADAAFENANELLVLAQHALEHGNAGHAIAIATIANEEVAKAYGCYIVAEGIMDENDPSFRALFYDHYEKTQQMLAFYLQATVVMHQQMGIITPEDFLREIVTATPREIAEAEKKINREITKSALKIENRRKRGMYVGLKRHKGKLKVQKPKNLKKKSAEKLINTVQDYHEIVSLFVKKIRQIPEARKLVKDFLLMVIEETKETATFILES